MGAGHLEGGGARCPGGGGEFRCAAAYPTPEQSTCLGRQNLHLFRLKNTRFDVIGGAFYFLLVVRLTWTDWHDAFANPERSLATNHPHRESPHKNAYTDKCSHELLIASVHWLIVIVQRVQSYMPHAASMTECPGKTVIVQQACASFSMSVTLFKRSAVFQ